MPIAYPSMNLPRLNPHILTPLEPTYTATWAVCPEPIREMLG